MATRRRFPNEVKIRIVQEYLGDMISRAAVARKHNIAPGQLATWQKQYEQGKLSDTPGDPALHQRVAELERLVGRLTLENDLLKKAAEWEARHHEEHSSKIVSGPGRSRSNGGAG